MPRSPRRPARPRRSRRSRPPSAAAAREGARLAQLTRRRLLRAIVAALVLAVLVAGVALVATRTGRAVLRRVAGVLGSAAPRLTIPEGFSRFDIADRLASRGICGRADFLAATTDRALLTSLELPGASAEGYLFPDTYDFERASAPDEVVRRMVDTFRERTAALFAGHAPALASQRLTPHDALVLASIVEKEAVVADEQPIIAGVFWNRLRRPEFTPHRLQADPTVSYGCLVARDTVPSCARFDGHRITRAMTNDALNPYNTYRNDGLPPGPISNPGLGAIEAALAPAAHDYFYFVARGGRRHTFSRTLAEHDTAVDAYHELLEKTAP